jgi:hypothetical protein
MDEKPPASALFNAYYYAHDCGEPYCRNDIWLKQFDSVAERICLDIQPTTVLDAGCALGLLVEVLRKRDVQAWGIDISEFAIENVHPDIRQYCRVGSITEPFEHPHYDLIVSIEVLEHLPKEDADKAIANLCQHTDDILFSSTPFDYDEATHFNVQPTEYWAERFARHGFFRDMDFDASFITTWAIRFRRQKMSHSGLAWNYERHLMPLLNGNIVLRKQVIKNRYQLEHMEQRLADAEQDNKNLGEQLTQERAKLQLSEQCIAELEQNRVDSTNQLAEAQTQLNVAVTRTEVLTHENAEAALQLAERRAQLDATRRRIALLEQENQAMRQQLVETHAQLTALQNSRWYKLAQILRSLRK